jgi:hypothetical protein
VKAKLVFCFSILIALCLVSGSNTIEGAAKSKAKTKKRVCKKAPNKSPSAIAKADGCALKFNGCDRKAVKNRRTDSPYTFHNGGRAISVADWFTIVCPLDPGVPARKEVPKNKAMKMEELKVKIRAFILAVVFEPDNDIHVQIADSPEFDQQQLVIEIPPGAAFCDSRSTFMALYRADGGDKPQGYKFKNPPLVEVTGYLFLDSAHMTRKRGDFCTQNGNRGFKGGLPKSPVRGIWELHPVIRIKRVSNR